MRRFAPLASILFLIVGLGLLLFGFPSMAARAYGPPAGTLNAAQVIQYSARLVWYDGLLTQPLSSGGAERSFSVGPGEPVRSVADRLAQAGLISDAPAFRDYLAYTGLDATVQAGQYKLSPAMSIVDIARRMQDATPAEVTFVILPGWRIEEIAAALPTSGLHIRPEDFIAAASAAPRGFDFLAEAPSAEGFLYPDTYIVPRTVTADSFLGGLLRNFGLHLTVDLREGFARQGLSVFQAVSLASIVQREAVHDEEAALIASVYLNRLKIKMKLDADPTVQYALGYDPAEGTWWTSPLSLENLQIASPYNTYLHDGLPPSPIDNPGVNALRAVALPADSPYYYFQARCDGSGYHDFAETFEEQMQNLCP
jgi:peptidoglycan lytic transglycosylase G